MNRSVKVSRGTVVGIGKVKIPRTQEFNYEIQLLSFIDIKESEDSFISTCIHLHIDGYGKSIEEAEEDMVENIYFFLCENFRKLPYENAWDNLLDLFKSDEWSNELWDAYHEAQIHLSMAGKTTDNIANLSSRLKQLEELIKEWETKVKDIELEEARVLFASEIRTLAKALIVDSIRIGKAA
ncbi:MAG: hypothetical protein FWD13_11320 [Treponema sp.]|nr:hypothetical protein [Treponema sp.]